MPVQKTKKIWHNGKLIDWDDANIHVTSHVISYGSALFEGIRCYDTEKGPAVFRLDEHIDRLFLSAGIYNGLNSYSLHQWQQLKSHSLCRPFHELKTMCFTKLPLLSQQKMSLFLKILPGALRRNHS